VKRKRFSVEQIVGVLKQVEVGVPVAELIRQVGISEQTLYRWKKQYKGLETDQVRQFKQLQEENGRLKRLVAELTLGKSGDRRDVPQFLHATEPKKTGERPVCPHIVVPTLFPSPHCFPTLFHMTIMRGQTEVSPYCFPTGCDNWGQFRLSPYFSSEEHRRHHIEFSGRGCRRHSQYG